MFVATSLCIVLLAKYGASSDIWQSQLEFNKMGDGIMYPRSEVNNRNAIGISSDGDVNGVNESLYPFQS